MPAFQTAHPDKRTGIGANTGRCALERQRGTGGSMLELSKGTSGLARSCLNCAQRCRKTHHRKTGTNHRTNGVRRGFLPQLDVPNTPTADGQTSGPDAADQQMEGD